MVGAQRHDLEQKNQELQTFAYALAHDLRAPLRAITSFAEIMEQEYWQTFDESGKHYMDVIIKSCKQINRLIDDLLSYTRIEHRTVRDQPVALHMVAMQIVNDLADRIAATGTTIRVPEDLPSVHGDSTLISQIFINLLDNALTYRRPDRPLTITIACTRTARNVVLSISDNGIGIAKKHYEKIFTIFQRLHSNDEYAGTGIGLAIVKKSAELMGGQVWVESQEGEGSTFYIRLPQ